MEQFKPLISALVELCVELTVMSCCCAGQQSEGESAQPAVEEEAPEVQDGSLWWHGMFTRAGRMGNMASDIRSDGQEQGKKVCNNAPETIHASCSDGNLKFHWLLCSSVCGILLLLLNHLSFCGSIVLKVC